MEFERLVVQHKDSVYRQMVRVCGNREDAEDVLTDALMRAWKHLDKLEDAGAFRAWLARIGQRVCWRLKNRAALMPLLQLSAMTEGGAGIAAQAVGMEADIDGRRMKDLLWRMIEELPEAYREVYRMRDIEDVPGDEAARRLGVSVAAMKSRLRRARLLVRERLDAELLEKGISNA